MRGPRRHDRVLSIGLVVVVVAAALTACVAEPNAVNTPGSCSPPGGAAVTLVYPAPNATAIADNFSAVVLASSTALPTNFETYVSQAAPTPVNAVYFGTVTAAPSPLPTPNATPSFTNAVYSASNSSGIAWPATSTLNVYLAVSGSTCLPTYFLGSFKTQ